MGHRAFVQQGTGYRVQQVTGDSHMSVSLNFSALIGLTSTWSAPASRNTLMPCIIHNEKKMIIVK
jgi:hypothetical protein